MADNIVQRHAAAVALELDWEGYVELNSELHGIDLSQRQISSIARALADLARRAGWDLLTTSRASHD